MKTLFVNDSGPAGVSASMALLKRGLLETMVEAGRTIEKELSEKITRLRAKNNLFNHDIRRLKRGGEVNISGVEEKNFLALHL